MGLGPEGVNGVQRGPRGFVVGSESARRGALEGVGGGSEEIGGDCTGVNGWSKGVEGPRGFQKGLIGIGGGLY